MSIGEILRQVRLKLDRSLADVSEGAHISKSHLWSIETNKSRPTVDVLQKLSEYYHIPISTLTGENKQKSKTSDKIMFIINNLSKKDQKKVLKILEIFFE